MAAPTDVRAEALSITSVILRWTYGGSSALSIYQSTDGVTYSSVAVLASTATSYTVTGLSTGTKYWFKISDDNGSTFSSVVTVYTMSCGSPQGGSMPTATQASGDTPTADEFNDLSDRVEEGLTVFRTADGQTCVACITDGALVIDCVQYSQCDEVDVPVDQDINSISMPNCDNSIKTINFIIPPNTNGRKICGFPSSLGFTGDECFQAPITTGADGTTMSVGNRGGGKPQSKAGVRGGGSGGGGGGGAACTCVPGQAGRLTIKSCNANNSLNCATNKSLTLLACGGRGPYTWSKTGSITLQVGDNGTAGSTASGSRVIVKPPTNSGTGVAGTAYQLWNKFTASGVGCENWTASESHNCDDSITGCTTQADFGTPSVSCVNGDLTLLSQLSCSQPGCCSSACSGAVQCPSIGCNTCTCTQLIQGGPTYMCDKRTPTMVSNGCNPCGAQAGSTVTVTDALGTSVTITVRA